MMLKLKSQGNCNFWEGTKNYHPLYTLPAAQKLKMQTQICILLFCWQAAVFPRHAVQAAGLNTATQSYEKMLENVRSGIFDDPDHPTAVKTELEAVLDSSKGY